MKEKTTSRKLGRPRLEASARRSERVAVMFTIDEAAALRQLAEEAGVSVSTLCHDRITDTLNGPSVATMKTRKTKKEGSKE